MRLGILASVLILATTGVATFVSARVGKQELLERAEATHQLRADRCAGGR